MLSSEMLLGVSNLLLFMLLSKMALKARVARKIAMRLLTDDIFYHETRSVLIQKSVEQISKFQRHARLTLGSRAGTVNNVVNAAYPQVAWAAALHTSTRIRMQVQCEAQPSILEMPYVLWASTWVSKDKPWSTTVGLEQAEEKVTRSQNKPAAAAPARRPKMKERNQNDVAKSLLNFGLAQQPVPCD